MDKKILAIFDGEESYAYRLMNFIGERENLPFELYVFTNKERFYSCERIRDQVMSHTVKISGGFCHEKRSIRFFDKWIW